MNDLPPEEDPRYRRMRAIVEFDQWSTSEEEAVRLGFKVLSDILESEATTIIDVTVHE